jgi:hypothetical protein
MRFEISHRVRVSHAAGHLSAQVIELRNLAGHSISGSAPLTVRAFSYIKFASHPGVRNMTTYFQLCSVATTAIRPLPKEGGDQPMDLAAGY